MSIHLPPSIDLCIRIENSGDVDALSESLRLPPPIAMKVTPTVVEHGMSAICCAGMKLAT